MSISFSDVRPAPGDYLPPVLRSAPTTSASSITATSLSVDDVARVSTYVATRGFIFHPWQVAAFVTAVRTKPLVILAGISGTGKSALPKLVADATGAYIDVVPVQPSWHDSSELVGYDRLDGVFKPGPLLKIVARAVENPEQQHFLLLDEMNIARPEYYLSDVLSRIEETATLAPDESGRSIAPNATGHTDSGTMWSDLALPSNLAIVGSVNMDETTFGFSRKVLDRAFVIEFSDIDLEKIGAGAPPDPHHVTWPSSLWRRAASNLSEHPGNAEPIVTQVISTLRELNAILDEAQLQVGYRVRDEISLFCLAAEPFREQFQTLDDGQVEPLDLAIAMKVLPRVQGSGPGIGRLLNGLAGWAQPSESATTSFPTSKQRIALMLTRYEETGFTSYWM